MNSEPFEPSDALSTESIWKQFHHQLHGFFRNRIRDEHLVADLLQETFVRIHKNLSQLDDSERVLAWVFRIARSVLGDHLRGTPAILRLGDEDPEDPDDVDATNYNAEIGRWLQGMIPSLPETYRDALRLAEVEGLGQKAVATELNLTHSGAKSRIQRGRTLLKEMLARCCHIQFDRYGNVVDCTQHGTCSACVGPAEVREENTE